ncbi:FkbM family methyltransferase [Halomonas sp. KX33721]|uniref:FkbM family methyltransferase n=1 Tax=Halomonas sp. KX33721 TaxID=1819251 RepID=UPI000783F9C2|nr:FkbM family methyltransferase [Halomonas sp. KX33721]
MADNIFEISVDDHAYRMVLPHWQTDYIQGLLATKHEPYELEMLRAMAGLLKPGEVVLDVGANIGNHSMYLAVVAGCRVWAFEPNPELCSAFQKSIRLNRLGRQITHHCKAIGRGKGRARFVELLPENIGAQALELLAPDDEGDDSYDVIALDILRFRKPVRAIKADVEGMELDVLEGARKLISKDKPLLFIEAQAEDDFEALHTILVELGYVYWDTFNATPTHCFIHRDELGEDQIIDHYYSKGKDSYKLLLQLRQTKDQLNSANLKYRDAIARIDTLKQKLSDATAARQKTAEQYSVLKEKYVAVVERLKAQIERLRSGGDKK